MNASPLEAIEQQSFVIWLESQNIKFSALPLSTFSKSWKVKARNKAEGVRAGVPDMMIIVKCGDNKHRLVFIEMKRIKGGVVSKHQKEWINALEQCEEVGAYVCNGFEEAKEKIESIMNFTKITWDENQTRRD